MNYSIDWDGPGERDHDMVPWTEEEMLAYYEEQRAQAYYEEEQAEYEWQMLECQATSYPSFDGHEPPQRFHRIEG